MDCFGFSSVFFIASSMEIVIILCELLKVELIIRTDPEV